MKIILTKIKLEYFKGIKDLTLEFNPGTNSVMGTNGSGKTTIFDAYTWCLFGKAHTGESDSKFTLKTLDSNNRAIPKVDHSVTLWLDVDGQEHILQRILKESWVKKRGSLEAEFSGNSTSYFYNEVPVSKGDYEKKISQLISEDLFKLLSNPLEFPTRHWQDQRNILINIVGEVNDSQIAKGNKSFEELLSKLSNKSFEEYKTQLAAQRKKLNDEIKLIPSRIDEQQKSKPEEVDFKALEKEYAEVDKELGSIEEQIDDRNKQMDEVNKKYAKISEEIHSLSLKNQSIEFSVKSEVQNANKVKDPSAEVKINLDSKKEIVDRAQSKLNNLQSDLAIVNENISNTTKEKADKLKEWETENAKELNFSDTDFNCPTCKRPLDSGDIEEEKQKMLSDFKSDKATALARINREGLLLKGKIESLTKQKGELESRIQDGKTYLEELQDELESIQKVYDALKEKPIHAPDIEELYKQAIASNNEYQDNIAKISGLKEQLENRISVNVSDLKEKRTELNLRVDEIKTLLSRKGQIAKSDERIKELEEMESNYAQQIADIEKQQFIAQEFTIKKVTTLENKVNALFENLKVKMFTQQVNGAEVETCELILVGVSFNDLNTASKIKAGLELISALNEHYDTQVPVWIDNSESVSVIPNTKSQQIRLYVSPEHKELTVI